MLIELTFVSLFRSHLCPYVILHNNVHITIVLDIYVKFCKSLNSKFFQTSFSWLFGEIWIKLNKILFQLVWIIEGLMSHGRKLHIFVLMAIALVDRWYIGYISCFS